MLAITRSVPPHCRQVQPADDVVAVDMPVGHQRAPMCAAAVQDADLVIVTDHDEIDARDPRVSGLAIREFIEIGDWTSFHDLVSLLHIVAFFARGKIGLGPHALHQHAQYVLPVRRRQLPP